MVNTLLSYDVCTGVAVWDSTSAGVEVSGALRDVVAASPAAEELAPGKLMCLQHFVYNIQFRV